MRNHPVIAGLDPAIQEKTGRQSKTGSPGLRFATPEDDGGQTTRWRFGAAALALASGGLLLMGQGVMIHAKAIYAQHLLESAFDKSLKTGQPVKPWGWADTWPVARIEVPRIGASAVVLHGGSGHALAFGPGHLETTPQPGDPGAAVISAHRDTHFRFLKEVKIGDEIRVVRRDGVRATFRVRQMSVVRWDQSGIDPARQGRWLVLATCWPLDAASQGPLRYLVHAQLIASEPNAIPSPPS